MSLRTEYPHMLNDDQVRALASIQKGLAKMAELASRISTMNADHQLGLRPLACPDIGMVHQQVERRIFDHELDEGRFRRHLGAEPERRAS